MANLNKVTLIGRLGKDPEIKNFSNGGRVANFSLAVTETWRDKNTGEKQERTEWVNVVVSNESIIKYADSYVKKGYCVFVEGKLQTRKWQDNNGVDRYVTEVIIPKYRGEMQILSSKTPGTTSDNDERSSKENFNANHNHGHNTNNNRNNGIKPNNANAGNACAPFEEFEDGIPF